MLIHAALFLSQENGEQAMQTNASFTGCSAYLGYANWAGDQSRVARRRTESVI